MSVWDCVWAFRVVAGMWIKYFSEIEKLHLSSLCGLIDDKSNGKDQRVNPNCGKRPLLAARVDCQQLYRRMGGMWAAQASEGRCF